MTHTTRELLAAFCFLLIVAIGTTAYYFLQTSQGLTSAVSFTFDHFIDADAKSFKNVRGSLFKVLTINDIVVKNLKGLPPCTLLIQKLIIIPHGLDYKSADIEIFNGRLMLPSSDTIVINGTYRQKGVFTLDIFSTAVDVGEILQIAQLKKLYIQGGIKNLDIQISGSVPNAHLQGRLTIEKLSKEDFILTQGPASVDMDLSDEDQNLKLKGNIVLYKGELQSRKTKITLKKSSAFISDDPKNPALSIQAFSKIEDVDIDISVKGTLKKPDLKLSSDPPLPSEILMVMLATGRKWQGLEELEQGQLTPDIVKDFVGYLFFSGSGEGFLIKMGITDLKVNLKNGQREIGFKKQMTKKLDLDYDLQQKTLGSSVPTVYQTLGADYRVSNRLYASFERQVPKGGGTAPNDQDIDNRFLLKYKRKF